eukprot:Macronucleus_9469.p1 GENE.Macronucleus_9469~~Macronucleus_9469.p1  ORF type:complete len:103 (+),score=37.90 Macronucleus_9469:1-309(+)
MEEQRRAMKEQKSAMMSQILSEEARVRLGNIAAVKPEKADRLENIIIQNAQRGAFQGKVSESQLIDLLEQVGQVDPSSGVSVERSKHKFDDEDELDIDNMDF